MASLAIRVTVSNDGLLNGIDARKILGRGRSLPSLPAVQGDGLWLKGDPRTRERAQILDVLAVRIPSAKHGLDLPVYLRPQRTVGLTGGAAATRWNYGLEVAFRHVLHPKEFSGAARRRCRSGIAEHFSTINDRNVLGYTETGRAGHDRGCTCSLMGKARRAR
jgi:hypothetical protein